MKRLIVASRYEYYKMYLNAHRLTAADCRFVRNERDLLGQDTRNPVVIVQTDFRLDNTPDYHAACALARRNHPNVSVERI